MSRTSPSLLSPTQGLSLAAETLLMRSEKDQSDNNFNFNCDNFLTCFLLKKADAKKFLPWLQRSDDLPAGQFVVRFTNQLAASEAGNLSSQFTLNTR